MSRVGIDHVTCLYSGNEILEKENDIEEIDKNFEKPQLEIPTDDTLLGENVNSEEEAYELYCDYGFCKGFSTRKGKQAYFAGTKNIRMKEYYCSKQGYKNDDLPSDANFSKSDTRTRCKAMIRCTVDEQGQWRVTRFIDEHNHSLASPEERHLLRSVRTVSTSKGGVLQSMINAGIRTINAFSYMAEESGGPENVGFTKKDCYNFINARRMKLIEVGDSQSLVNLFKTRAHQEGGMYYWDVRLDKEGRMTNFYWRDGRYNMICTPFVGVNHHWQNIMFGCAFLSHETTESFQWLFSTFLESMGGKQPTTIITDQDNAMTYAIKSVFPNTRHRLCLWHISKNVPSHLGSLNSNKEFHSLFHKCMQGCESEVEFEEAWAKMISDFTDGEHKWLNNLYKIRKKWCTALNKDVFDGGIKASQRSESTNNVINGMTNKSTSLTKFVLEFEKLVTRWRKNETEEDYNCHQKAPTCVIKHSNLLKHAAQVYTHKIYKLFEKEYLDGCGASNFKEIPCDDNLYRFELMMQGRGSKVRQVHLDMSTMEVHCSCKKFTTIGILCAHALVVFNFKNVSRIPNQYILKRWSKDAKIRVHAYGQTTTSRDSNEIDSSYRNRSMQYAYDLVTMSQGQAEARQILWKHFDHGYNALKNFFKKSSLKEGSNGSNRNEKVDEEYIVFY